MKEPHTVAIFGAGVMGETLLSGLLRAGHSPHDLVITERRDDRAQELTARYGVRALTNVEAAAIADTLVLVVKPQDMGALLDEIAPHVEDDNLVVSLAAGITTDFVAARLPEGRAIVRVMPNTPALVDQGMAAISGGAHCSAEHLAEARSLLAATAYIFYVVEAMIEAGVVLGMPRPLATELVVQTLFGAATMIRETGQHPTVLREQVTSPGGTTAAALRALDDHKVRAAFITAMEAAAQRSKELASG